MENLRRIKFKILMERIQNGGLTFAGFCIQEDSGASKFALVAQSRIHAAF